MFELPFQSDTSSFDAQAAARAQFEASAFAERVRDVAAKIADFDFRQIFDESASETVVSNMLTREHAMPAHIVSNLMVSALELKDNAKVLQIGTGNAYVPTLLRLLGNQVYSIEKVPAVALAAIQRLQQVGCGDVHVKVGEGESGWPECGPYDGIVLSYGDAAFPIHLISQLKIGAYIVYAEGPARVSQSIVRIVRTIDGHRRESLGSVRYIARLGDIVVDMGVAKREAVEAAASRALEKDARIGTELSLLPNVGTQQIYRALALQRGIAYSDFSRLAAEIDSEVVQLLPLEFARRNNILPIADRNGVVILATSNPDFDVQELQKAFSGKTIVPVLVTETDFRRLFSVIELSDLRLGSATRPDAIDAVRDSTTDVNIVQSDATALRATAIANAILLDAIGERASDIHIEREQKSTRIRIRVDGELRDLLRHNLSFSETLSLINVLKVRANLDISERRVPQGGRTRIRSGEQEFDLRLQVQPSLHGESVTIRLLSRTMPLLSVHQLGFPKNVADHYRRLLFSPAGMVLVVGPTGSGKSTSLYAGLQVLARDTTRKVVSIEDPIEYSISGITQTQVNAKANFNFSDAMRSFVRLDPNVILVGEIRDADTAKEAIRASQTGHVVLSTLHCNDATDAVQRLIDLDMHPNSIASELRFVVAQRLAKRICEACREPAYPEPELVREIFPNGAASDFAFFRGRGCQRCSGTGTWGRVAVVEAMSVTSKIRTAISKRASLDEIREVALREGLHTMRKSALELVHQGVIALEQVSRVLPLERMSGG